MAASIIFGVAKKAVGLVGSGKVSSKLDKLNNIIKPNKNQTFVNQVSSQADTKPPKKSLWDTTTEYVTNNFTSIAIAGVLITVIIIVYSVYNKKSNKPKR